MKRKIYNKLREWKEMSNGTRKITNRHNISPIEEKSGKRFSLISLEKCIKKYAEYLSTAFVLYDGDLKVENDIVYLPLYMTPILK